MYGKTNEVAFTQVKKGCCPEPHLRRDLWRRTMWRAEWACASCLQDVWGVTEEQVLKWLTPGGSDGKGQGLRAADWWCERGFHNFGRRTQCHRCEKEKPSGPNWLTPDKMAELARRKPCQYEGSVRADRESRAAFEPGQSSASGQRDEEAGQAAADAGQGAGARGGDCDVGGAAAAAEQDANAQGDGPQATGGGCWEPYGQWLRRGARTYDSAETGPASGSADHWQPRPRPTLAPGGGSKRARDEDDRGQWEESWGGGRGGWVDWGSWSTGSWEQQGWSSRAWDSRDRSRGWDDGSWHRCEDRGRW